MSEEQHDVEPAAVMERTGIRCDNCGDRIVPEYLDTAKEMAGSRCSGCGDGFFELVDVETVPIYTVRSRLDRLEDERKEEFSDSLKECSDCNPRKQEMCDHHKGRVMERKKVLERLRSDLTGENDG